MREQPSAKPWERRGTPSALKGRKPRPPRPLRPFRAVRWSWRVPRAPPRRLRSGLRPGLFPFRPVRGFGADYLHSRLTPWAAGSVDPRPSFGHTTVAHLAGESCDGRAREGRAVVVQPESRAAVGPAVWQGDESADPVIHLAPLRAGAERSAAEPKDLSKAQVRDRAYSWGRGQRLRRGEPVCSPSCGHTRRCAPTPDSSTSSAETTDHAQNDRLGAALLVRNAG